MNKLLKIRVIHYTRFLPNENILGEMGSPGLYDATVQKIHNQVGDVVVRNARNMIRNHLRGW